MEYLDELISIYGFEHPITIAAFMLAEEERESEE